MRILLVEDDPVAAADLDLLLPPTFEILRAKDSRQAMAILGDAPPPDAIILDLNLPAHLAPDADEEGLALLAFIRRELASAIPVIVLSSNPPEFFAERCRRLGALVYLQKPCRISELVDHLLAARRG